MIPYAITAVIGAMLWLLVGGLGVPPCSVVGPGRGGGYYRADVCRGGGNDDCYINYYHYINEH